MKRHGPNAEKESNPKPSQYSDRDLDRIERESAVAPEMVVAQVTKDEHRALQACWDGVADSFQQRQALQVLMAKPCGLYTVPYFGERPQASAFMAGRQFVGRVMMRILDTPIGIMPDTEENENG